MSWLYYGLGVLGALTTEAIARGLWPSYDPTAGLVVLGLAAVVYGTWRAQTGAEE